MISMKWFLVLVIFPEIIFGQNLNLNLKSKTPLSVEKYEGTDKFGNIYYLNEGVFYKTGKDGDYQFKDLQLGNPTSSDLINPLKIVLFYESTNTVVFLDRHLIEIQRINFNLLPNFKTIRFVNEASGDKIWIFNLSNQQLELFNYIQKSTITTSQPISQKVLDQKSNLNFCWLLTTNSIKKYNIYGSLLGKMVNPGYSKLSEDNGNLVAQHDSTLFYKAKGFKNFQKLDFQKIKLKNFYLTDKTLYIYDGKFLYQFYLN